MAEATEAEVGMDGPSRAASTREPKAVEVISERSMASQAEVSVIVCSYNRSRLLERALRALSAQSLPSERFEVIVVDDGSTDDTPEVCRNLARQLPNLRYISTGANQGLSKARNAGLKAARSEYLLFIDDDCVAGPHWVERMGEALLKYDIAAGAVASPTESYLKLCHNISEFHPFMPGHKEEGPKLFIAGANMGLKRSVVEELGGFGQRTVPAEDMEFILRARERGYEINFVHEAEVTHDPERTSLSSIFGYSVQHASRTIILRNQYRALLGTPFVLRSPYLLLAAAPVIALRVTAGIYLRNPRVARLFWTAPMVFALKLAWCWGASRGLRRRASAEKGGLS